MSQDLKKTNINFELHMLAFKGKKNKALNFGFVGCFLVFCMSQLTSANVCLMLSSDYVCLAVLLSPERVKFWPTGSSV